MKTTDQLSRDHQAILRSLEILKSAATAWQSEYAGSAEDCRSLIEFLKTFADSCHHGKEERVLFPKLTDAGMPTAGGPLGVILDEHEQGRELIRAMERALATGSAADFAHHANRYAQLLEQHIAKEDNILFPKAGDVLTHEDDEALLRRFDEIEHEMGDETHERFHKMLDMLEWRYLSKPSKAS